LHYDSLLSTQLLELFIQLVALNKGGIMKGYLFGLGAMLVGAGLMFVLMHGEVRADRKPEPFVCSEVVESIFQGEAVHNLWHCQIANMSCGLSAKGISCEKRGLIERVLRGVKSIF